MSVFCYDRCEITLIDTTPNLWVTSGVCAATKKLRNHLLFNDNAVICRNIHYAINLKIPEKPLFQSGVL